MRYWTVDEANAALTRVGAAVRRIRDAAVTAHQRGKLVAERAPTKRAPPTGRVDGGAPGRGARVRRRGDRRPRRQSGAHRLPGAICQRAPLLALLGARRARGSVLALARGRLRRADSADRPADLSARAPLTGAAAALMRSRYLQERGRTSGLRRATRIARVPQFSRTPKENGRCRPSICRNCR